MKRPTSDSLADWGVRSVGLQMVAEITNRSGFDPLPFQLNREVQGKASSVSIRCPYVSSVYAAEWWPIRHWRRSGESPRSISIDAQV
jgi:hypothetical protein